MLVRIAILLLCLPVTASADSHPISITEADVYVTRERATVRLRMFAEDLALFGGIEPNDLDVFEPDVLEQATEDYKSFLSERVVLRDVAGEAVKGRLIDMEPFVIPPAGIENSEMMNHSLMYEFEYRFDEPQEFITFEQNITDANFIIPSEMRLAVKQAGSEAVLGQSLKPGTPRVIRFDWSNPPLSEEATDKEWDEWVNRQREEQLGITDYSSVYSFIYLTDYEVRHEVLIPLATLASIFQIDRRNPDFLEVDEQDAAREAVKKYLGSGNPVSIDGVTVQPVFDRIDFHALDLRDFAMRAPAKRISMANGRVGIIMSYSTKGTPAEVNVTWNKFSPNLNKIKSVVFEFDKLKKMRFSRFGTQKTNTYVWKNTEGRKRPEVANVTGPSLAGKPIWKIRPVACAGGVAGLLVLLLGMKKIGGFGAGMAGVGVAGLVGVLGWSTAIEVDDPIQPPPEISDREARELFQTLHRNTYRAFDYGTETEIYDALDSSVAGDLLKDVYLNVRKSLEVKEQGGAMARIREVEFLDGERMPSSMVAWPGYSYRSEWTVNGTIEHWGHIHERTNRFNAVFDVQRIDGKWKITAFDVLDEKRIKARTTLRKF